MRETRQSKQEQNHFTKHQKQPAYTTNKLAPVLPKSLHLNGRTVGFVLDFISFFLFDQTKHHCSLSSSLVSKVNVATAFSITAFELQ